MENLDPRKPNYSEYIKEITKTLGMFRLYQQNLHKFKRGPIVNFEIYEFYEQLRKNDNTIPDTTITNTEYFYNNVLKVILKYIVFDNNNNTYPLQLTLPNNVNGLKLDKNYSDTKIFAFAHGSLIREIWKTHNIETYTDKEIHHKLDQMMNTAIINDVITLQNITSNTIEPKQIDYKINSHQFSIDKYEPEKIRQSNYYNFESSNENICENNSVKGIINYIKDDEEISNNKYYEFYKENNNLPSQIAGSYINNDDKYKNKYLKYKTKYLELKNKL
jgi:hypothetical protein